MTTTKKTISIDKANAWLKALVAKAIDCGTIETTVGQYYSELRGRYATYSYTKYSYNAVSVKVWEEGVEVYYWNDHDFIKWDYTFVSEFE